jgi:1-deoxy-D-xylulose-5-phosphate synthase
VVAIYSSFLQRAYDQLIHDVALQNLPVVFALDRGGLVGNDGPTHHGAYDLSFMRCIPNMVVMAPADENECRQMLYTGVTLDGPSAVRYPRGRGPGAPIETAMRALPLGKAELRRRGRGVALLAFGAMVPVAEQVAARARRDGGQHALRQAARRGDGARAMAESHGTARDPGGQRPDGRRGQRGGRMPGGAPGAGAAAEPRHSRPLHRARLARRVPRCSRPGRASVLESVRAWQRRPELRSVGEA